MASEPENSTLKLPLFSSIPSMASPEHPGMATPPLFTSASVPFTWEEQPGKPRPCTAIIPFPTTTNNQPKSLEPPPRLYTDTTRLTKTPSPNTVLDGPYITSRPKFTSSSFRIFRHRRQTSFDSNGSKTPDRELYNGKKKHKRKGLSFPAWTSKNEKKEAIVNGVGGSFVFPATVDASEFDETSYEESVDMDSKVRRNGSLSNHSQTKPHFWTSVYEGFKQVIPWKSRKPRKGVGVV